MDRDAAIEQLTMPIVYVQHLARVFPQPERLLAGTSLGREDLVASDRSISVRDDLRCVANAMAMADTPYWYHRWAIRIAEHYHGPLTTAWLHAPTLGQGLEAFVRYFPRRVPYMEIRSRAEQERLVIELRPLLDVGELLPLLVEVPLLILQHYVGTIRNEPMSGARIELAYTAPAGTASYAATFECAVHFEQSRNRLLVPLAWLEVDNLAYDELAWRAALARCSAGNVVRTPRDTMAAVRHALLAAFDAAHGAAPVPTLKEVAAKLAMSPRTLIRRLGAVGTTFSEELDDVRRERARELLGTGLRVADVATRLRYTDTTSFTKAFRRWYGTAPSRYRGPLPMAD